MIDETQSERLNDSIEGILAGGSFTPAGDEDVDALARLASGLRGFPDPNFRSRLAAEFRPEKGRLPVPRFSQRWLRANAPFLAGGASSGLVGGACCVSGFTVHVLGLASAAWVTSYIHATIPYFMALSIVSILAWVAWLLRDQGLTLLTFLTATRRHGLALAGSYAAVFGSSMTLAMAAGLY